MQTLPNSGNHNLCSRLCESHNYDMSMRKDAPGSFVLSSRMLRIKEARSTFACTHSQRNTRYTEDFASHLTVLFLGPSESRGVV